MRFRFCTLLCLSGIVACSHNSTEVAKDPTAEEQSDAAMYPASLDGEATPSSRHGDAATHGSVPVDTTRTQSGELRSNESTPSPDPEKGSTAAAPASGVAADNTKVNERDTNSAALTPMDQNNNQSDLEITQKIRQSVMADDSLSFTAKNVKIITQNGKVTLRGPVKSAAERSAIEAAARKVAGSGQVDNQLEVKN